MTSSRLQEKLNCFFCSLPSDTALFTTEHFSVRFDNYPTTPGHILIIANTHTPLIEDMPPVAGKDLFGIIQKLTSFNYKNVAAEHYESIIADPTSGKKSKQYCKDALQKIHFLDNIGSYNLGVNDGPESGQTVPHLHIHLIPRHKEDDGVKTGGVRCLFKEKTNYLESSS